MSPVKTTVPSAAVSPGNRVAVSPLTISPVGVQQAVVDLDQHFVGGNVAQLDGGPHRQVRSHGLGRDGGRLDRDDLHLGPAIAVIRPRQSASSRARAKSSSLSRAAFSTQGM